MHPVQPNGNASSEIIHMAVSKIIQSCLSRLNFEALKHLRQYLWYYRDQLHLLSKTKITPFLEACFVNMW